MLLPPPNTAVPGQTPYGSSCDWTGTLVGPIGPGSLTVSFTGSEHSAPTYTVSLSFDR
jgi:hypothetical protein